jgi:hypothetical protein
MKNQNRIEIHLMAFRTALPGRPETSGKLLDRFVEQFDYRRIRIDARCRPASLSTLRKASR